MELYVCFWEERTSLHWEGWLIFGPFLEIKPKTSVSNSLAWVIMNIILRPSCLYPGTYSQLTESGILGDTIELNHADRSHPAVQISAHSCYLFTKLCSALLDCSLLGSSVHEIFQVRILEWVAIFCCRVSSQPKDQASVSCVFWIAGRFFTTEPQGKPC